MTLKPSNDFPMKEPIHIISLGAGVQSSTMALMAAKGELTPMPTSAIFADTQAEPESVYRFLDWLEKELPFPVYRVSKGNLGDDFLNALKSVSGRAGQPPFFVKNPEKQNDSIGVLWRKCTQEYKLQPIRRKVREIMRESGAKSVKQWIGISLDEAHRMKPSGVKFVENVFPLIESQIDRGACLRWMKKNKYPEPPKSACIFCPYHNDALWLKMKRSEPKEFERAVQFERAVKKEQGQTINGAKIYGQIFLHRSCRTLDQVIFKNELEPSLFGNECEGMCGV